MISKGNKDLVGLFWKRQVAMVYKGTQLVWEAVSSCFGKGWWQGDLGWRGDEGWAGG